MSTLEPISPNRSLTFYSPLEGENEQLVRTGTLGDLIHAILHCCDQEYIRKNDKERKEYAKDLLNSLMDEDVWSQTEGADKEIDKNMQEIMADFYEAIEKNGCTKNKNVTRVMKKIKVMNRLEVYKLITELIPLDEMTDTALQYLDNTDEMKELSIKKASSLRSIVSGLLNIVKNTATKSAYKKHKENSDLNSPENIPIFCEHFHRDIYVIDSKNRIPFYWNGSGKEKAIILMAMKNNHYEPIGRLLAKRRIQREYDLVDPLVKKIRTFLDNPGKVKSKYPELLSYLKTAYQSDSDSE